MPDTPDLPAMLARVWELRVAADATQPEYDRLNREHDRLAGDHVLEPDRWGPETHAAYLAICDYEENVREPACGAAYQAARDIADHLNARGFIAGLIGDVLVFDARRLEATDWDESVAVLPVAKVYGLAERLAEKGGPDATPVP